MKETIRILNVLVFSLVGLLSHTVFADHGIKKVIWIVLENTNVSDALKDPFLAELVQRGSLMQSMTGESHPSEPNYVAMIAGDTMGVFADDDVNLSGNHLGDLLEQKGKTWKAYAEGFPGNCFSGSTSGNYARKHVPFISFINISQNPSRCENIVDGTQFDQDLAAGTLPDYSMYTPDLQNDGHDTNVTFASKFLEQKFGALIRDADFMKDKLIVVTFDESETYFSNNIYTVLLGGMIQPGSVATEAVNHVSLLRLIESEWNLGSLSRQDDSAVLPTGIWQALD